MSKKNDTKPTAKDVKENNESKKLTGTHIFLIVFASVALLGIIASIIVGVALNSKNKKSFDFMTADLSKYVYVSEALYDGYGVDINIPEPTELDVEYAIIELRCANKTKPDDKTPINAPGVTIDVGDVANIYYRGYYYDDDGIKTYFDGGCNFDESLYSLEIGSGEFIPGFEYNLINKNQKDYATLEKLSSGQTQYGDIVQLTYSVFYADGTTAQAKTALIDLADPSLDQTWGEGFSAYFNVALGKPIGELFAGENSNDTLTVKSVKADGTDLYYNMKINEAYRVNYGSNGDKDKLEVEAYFPYDYDEASLCGRTATFEVYIVTAQDYDAPDFTDEFITDTLNVSAEELADYEGESLADKYKNLIRAELWEEYEAEVRAAKEDAFWEQVLAGAEYKALPESEVEAYYEEYVAEVTEIYGSGYSDYYDSLDSFAIAYLGLSTSDDWKAVLRSDAEESIKQKLVFYYIIREKDFIPNDDEYAELYESIFVEYLQSYLDYYEITESTENYEAKVAEGRKVVTEAYGADYFEELVIYEYAMEKIVALAVVN